MAEAHFQLAGLRCVYVLSTSSSSARFLCIEGASSASVLPVKAVFEHPS